MSSVASAPTARVVQEGTCAIHGAAREGHADAVAVLLSVGADVLVLDKVACSAFVCLAV